MDDFALLRQRMVDNQIRPSEVTDPQVIQAFLSVSREKFVAPDQRPFAYGDRDVPLSPWAPGRRMMPPVQLARLVQALEIKPGARVLVVAGATGYSAAIVEKLGAGVVLLEEDEALAGAAQGNLAEAGIRNAQIVNGAHVRGHAAGAPYDAILIDGAIEVLPEGIAGQLAAGGRVAAIERDDRLSRAMIYERVGDDVTKWPLFDAWLDVLPGFERVREFVF